MADGRTDVTDGNLAASHRMDISSFFFNNGCVVVKLNSVACSNLLLAGRPLRHAQASPFILQAARLYPLQRDCL